MIVIDANILVYYLCDGEYTQSAQNCFEKDPQWIAPSIIVYEFHNVLSGYEKRSQLNHNEVIERYKAALELLEEYDYLPDGETLFNLTSTTGCTSYDCAYIALAQQRSIRLVTADNALLKAFPETAVSMENFIE